MKKHIAWTISLVLFFAICVAGSAIGMEKEKPIGTGNLTEQAQQIHRELLGKVKKLESYDDIYVGAGYSDAGEPIFFGMEKLDDQRAQAWKNYVGVLHGRRYENMSVYGEEGSFIKFLERLNDNCDNQKYKDKLEKEGDSYFIMLMKDMCPNQQKISAILGGTIAGILGFSEMLGRQAQGQEIYGAYASKQPITGPFKPKTEITYFPSLELFDYAYEDVIMTIGIDLKNRTCFDSKSIKFIPCSSTEHRGIFKNPFCVIDDEYKNIAMKLHGWAGAVEKQIFNKRYMTVFPTEAAAEILHKTVKPGDMYIGVDTSTYPYKDEELRKKFPSIKDELVDYQGSYNVKAEVLHAFDLDVLSKYYTESSEKK